MHKDQHRFDEKSKVKTRSPKWWTNDHTSAWDRVKAAFKRDWEQTKADLTKGGRELNQDAGDTIKQAAGKQPIPQKNVPNAPDWDRTENAARYGYAARTQYAKEREWNDELERRLNAEWDEFESGYTWDESRADVRAGWEYAGRRFS